MNKIVVHYDAAYEPSSQRVRNILTLEERVQAIHAYDNCPVYTKIAQKFKCSWEQIKNIVANREAIMEFYLATKSQRNDPDKDQVRRTKIQFLNKCLYEYLQRVQCHTNVDITEELLRVKANELRQIIKIENFEPNKGWMNMFKNTYKFSLSNRQLQLIRRPPQSLDIQDVISYCSLNPTEKAASPSKESMSDGIKTTISMPIQNDATIKEIQERNKRKLIFLEKNLCEFRRRVEHHSKSIVKDDVLYKVTGKLKTMLKITDFNINESWLKSFKEFYANIEHSGGTPPLSFDLKDILSYCSRKDVKKLGTSTLKLKPKTIETLLPYQTAAAAAAAAITKTVEPTPNVQQDILLKPFIEIKEEIINLDDDDDDDNENKPNIEELKKLSTNSKLNENCDQPPFKIRRIQTISSNDHQLEENINKVKDIIKETIMPNVTEEQTEVRVDIENRIVETPSPGHWSEKSTCDENLPTQINDWNDCLKLLKPIEEYAMLQENFRVIGLISNLEEIFKNLSQKK